MGKLLNYVEKLYKLLFAPPICLFCASLSGDKICENCLNNLYFVYETFCPVCQNSSIDGAIHFGCIKRYTPTYLITPLYYSGV